MRAWKKTRLMRNLKNKEWRPESAEGFKDMYLEFISAVHENGKALDESCSRGEAVDDCSTFKVDQAGETILSRYAKIMTPTDMFDVLNETLPTIETSDAGKWISAKQRLAFIGLCLPSTFRGFRLNRKESLSMMQRVHKAEFLPSSMAGESISRIALPGTDDKEMYLGMMLSLFSLSEERDTAISSNLLRRTLSLISSIANAEMMGWIGYQASKGFGKGILNNLNKDEWEVFPPMFWISMKHNMRYESKNGSFLSQKLLSLWEEGALSKMEAESLVKSIWLTASKKEVFEMITKHEALNNGNIVGAFHSEEFDGIGNYTDFDLINPSSSEVKGSAWLGEIFQNHGFFGDVGNEIWTPTNVIEVLRAAETKLIGKELSKIAPKGAKPKQKRL